MKIYNALSKSFTDEVKTIMGGGKSIDEAFEEVKMSIFGWDLSPTPTPEPTTPPTTPPPTTPPPTTPPPTTPPPTTLPPIDVNELTRGDGEENGYHYVDLGLPSGLKWATCNVGASLASDEGLLFQWGRTDGYEYNDKNHKFRTKGQDKEVTGSDYIPLTTSGATYDKGATLGLEDDAAHVNMEGNWRMPTGSYNEDIKKYEGEWPELLENTNTCAATVNGVKGMLFTSKINGHKLFIPFMKGWWNGFRFDDLGSKAYVWSSQVRSSNTSAYRLFCGSGGDAGASIASSFRTYSISVRGVFQV